jgi:hypothetical protein
MLDKSRAVPVRTKAAIQYTLMPTVNYCEIVKCIEKYSSKDFKLGMADGENILLYRSFV